MKHSVSTNNGLQKISRSIDIMVESNKGSRSILEACKESNGRQYHLEQC